MPGIPEGFGWMILLFYVLLTGTSQWHSAGGWSGLKGPWRLQSKSGALVGWLEGWAQLRPFPCPCYLTIRAVGLTAEWLRALRDQGGSFQRVDLKLDSITSSVLHWSRQFRFTGMGYISHLLMVQKSLRLPLIYFKTKSAHSPLNPQLLAQDLAHELNKFINHWTRCSRRNLTYL